MAGKYQASGEAPKVHYENIYSKEFASNGKEAFLLRVTLINGKPKIGLSRFWHNFKDNEWYPSKDHFFVPVNVWENLVEFLPTGAAEIAQLNLSGMLEQLSFSLPNYYIKFFFLFLNAGTL